MEVRADKKGEISPAHLFRMSSVINRLFIGGEPRDMHLSFSSVGLLDPQTWEGELVELESLLILVRGDDRGWRQ